MFFSEDIKPSKIKENTSTIFQLVVQQINPIYLLHKQIVFPCIFGKIIFQKREKMSSLHVLKVVWMDLSLPNQGLTHWF